MNAGDRVTVDEIFETLGLVRSLVAVATAIPSDRLRRFVDQADREDTLGPVLSPTRWKETHDQAGKLRKLAAAALTFQAAIREAGFDLVGDAGAGGGES